MQSEQQAGALPAGPLSAEERAAIERRHAGDHHLKCFRSLGRHVWAVCACDAELGPTTETEAARALWEQHRDTPTDIQRLLASEAAMHQQAAAWAEERAAYREALEFYANDANWLPDSTNTDRYSRVAVDDGAKAQAALARAGRATAGGA